MATQIINSHITETIPKKYKLSDIEKPDEIERRSAQQVFVLSPIDSVLNTGRRPVSSPTPQEFIHIPVEATINDELDFLRTTEKCLAAIRERQPSGPYRVIGHRDGAMIAYNTALHLLGADQHVAFLGIVTAQDSTDSFDIPHIESLSSQLDYLWTSPIIDGHKLSEPQFDIKVNLFVNDGLHGEAARQIFAKRADVKLSILGTVGRAFSDELWNALAARLHETNEILAFPGKVNNSPLVTIQEGARAAPPIFCIPGAGASVTSFMSLTHALGEEIQMHGLQPRGMSGESLPHPDVASAAKYYILALKSAGFRKPVHLLGHSYGGWVAMEMAYQLAAQGEPPASLHLLDSRPPVSPDTPNDYLSFSEAMERLAEIYELASDSPINLDRAHFNNHAPKVQAEILLNELIKKNILSKRITSMAFCNLVRVFRSNVNTSFSQKQTYPYPVHLIVAQPTGKRPRLFVDDWKRYAPLATSWESSGNHNTLLSAPHVSALAQHVLNNLKMANMEMPD